MLNSGLQRTVLMLRRFSRMESIADCLAARLAWDLVCRLSILSLMEIATDLALASVQSLSAACAGIGVHAPAASPEKHTAPAVNSAIHDFAVFLRAILALPKPVMPLLLLLGQNIVKSKGVVTLIRDKVVDEPILLVGMEVHHILRVIIRHFDVFLVNVVGRNIGAAA